MPEYKVVGQTQVTVSLSGEKFYTVPAGDIPIQEYDVIGIQVAQGQNVLKCEDLPSGLDQQTVYKASITGWLDIFDNFPNYLITENRTCYIQALYTKDSIQYLPTNLGYSSETGDYDLSVSIVESNTHNLSVLLEESVDDIYWVYPSLSIAPPSFSSISLGTVYTKWNTNYNFTVRVERGTHLESVWSFDTSRIVSLTDSCAPLVTALVGEQCNSSLYWSEKPFASFEYNTRTVGSTTLSINFTNVLGRIEKQLTIQTEKDIAGLTFDLVTPSRIANTIAWNNIAQFDAAITEGTGVSYSFTINGASVPSTNSSLYYNFTYPGTQIVEALVQNIIGSQSETLTVHVKKPAEFTNCTFMNTPYIAAVGIPISLTLQCETQSGAEVSATWMLSDRSNNITFYTRTTFQTTEVWTNAVTFSAIQLGVQITAFTTDPFEEVATSTTVDVYNAIPSVDLTVSSFQVVPAENITFTASIPSSPGTYGQVTYTIDYGDGTAPVTSSSGNEIHAYISSGNYTVTVTATNGPSSQTVTQHIEVYDIVSGLAVTNDGPKEVGRMVTFTATVMSGNFLKFRFTSSVFDVTQDHGTFSYTFTAAADYLVSVECFNTLSHENMSLIAYVMDSSDIRITALKLDGSPFLGCLQTGITYEFSVEIIHYDAASVQYDWNFGNAVVMLNTNTNKEDHGYTTAGNYTVSVTAKYAAVSAETTITQETCVEEMIVSPSIVVSSPIGLPPSREVTEAVTITTSAGSNLHYSWSTNATAANTTNEAMFFVTFSGEGWYEITVNVSNNVNWMVDTEVVQVVTEISDLSINCSTCTMKYGNFYIEMSVSYQFTVSIATGTGVSYTWDFGDTNTAVGSSTSHTYSSVGQYTLTVTGSNSVSASFQQSVQVFVEVPITGVTLSTHFYDWHDLTPGGPKVLEIQKTAVLKAAVQPQNMVLTYDWYFDTGMAPITNTSNIGYHNYTTIGKKFCTVTARNMLNSVNSTELMFYIIQEITEVNVTANGVLLSESVNFIIAVDTNYTFTTSSGQIVEDTVKFLYIFRDENAVLIGSSATSSDPSWTTSFSNEMVYIMTLSVSYSLGTHDSQYTIEAIKPVSDVYITTPPDSNGNLSLGSSFTLSCGALVGKYLQYRWFYSLAPAGETISAPADNASVTVTPTSVGRYVITAELYNSVSSPQRVNYTFNVMVGVYGVDIDVNMSFPDAVKQNTTLTFNGQVAMGTDLSYSWEAAVSGSSVSSGSGQTFTFTFSTQALYNITLLVENYASSELAYKEIYSLYEVQAFGLNVVGSTFLNSINKHVASTGDNLTFTSTITNTDFISFEWQVNSTTVTTAETFQTLFNSPSVYILSLDASNKISLESNEKVIIVQDPITGLNVQLCHSTHELGTSVTLVANTVTGTGVNYLWQGDSQMSSQSSNIHMVTYNSVGIYDVNVTASNYVSQETKQCSLTILGRIANLAVTTTHYQFIYYPITFTVTGDYIAPANFTWVFSNGVTFETTAPTVDFTAANPGTYTVTITVSNAVSNDTVTLNFDVEDLVCAVPTLTIDGSSERTTFRARPVELAVSVDTGGCTNYTSSNEWTVYSASSCSASLTNVYPLNINIETNTPVLQIPGMRLDYGTYCVTFTHSYANTPVSEVMMFNLTIEASDLKALISGGDKISAAAGSTLTLDATESYDPDNTTGTTLTYAWSCTQAMVSNFLITSFFSFSIAT